MTPAGANVVPIGSRDNPLLKRLRRLQEQPAAYRKLAQFWIEGDHLCRAALARGVAPAAAVLAQSAWTKALQALQPLQPSAAAVYVLPDALFAEFSGLQSNAGFGLLVDMPPVPAPQPELPSLVLDRIQDAGNVGSILRSAAAFGCRQVLAIRGTAALWSPKVLRSAMGAHFGLTLVELLDHADVLALKLPLVVTSSHQGTALQLATFPSPCAWVFGHEGQGVATQLQQHAVLAVRIEQPGGEESINVAAAAAICLHAGSIAWRDTAHAPLPGRLVV